MGDENAITTVEDAVRFHSATGVDALAVSIGTVHGFYKSEPKIDALRCAEISEALPGVPLVLHGGTGTPPEALRAVIESGVSKVNIATEFMDTFLKSTRRQLDILDGKFLPVDKFMDPVVDDCAAHAARLMRFLREFSRAGLHTAALCACAVQKKRSLFFEFETRTLNKQKKADMRRLESHDNIYKWVLLLMLWVAYFLHQGTRQIYNAVLPQIQGDFQVDSASMGFVATSFSFTYGITVLFAGLASDFLRRKWMIVFGVLTFCAGIFISGFVSSIGLMMLTYGILNGLGQGCYYPPASSLLGQHFENMRSTAFSIHQTAQYLGIIICSCVAGFLGDLPSEGGYSGWRLPFFFSAG